VSDETVGQGQGAASGGSATSGSGQGPSKSAIVIKKYANRRLYNTATSEGQDFAVYDAKTGEDITRSVLTQIIFEEENKGENTLLPINFLRQLIRFYGDSMQSMVPGYLEFSMGNLLKDQDKLRRQMLESFGGDAFKAMEEQAKRNMQMFQDALKMFPGFSGGFPTGFPNPFATTAPEAPAEKPQGANGPSKDELQSLKDQLTAMQQKIDALNRN
jgi:polyhydroxyalkanoate synthesis repressor PhaR